MQLHYYFVIYLIQPTLLPKIISGVNFIFWFDHHLFLRQKSGARQVSCETIG